MEKLRNNSTLELLKQIGRYKHCVYRELIPFESGQEPGPVFQLHLAGAVKCKAN